LPAFSICKWLSLCVPYVLTWPVSAHPRFVRVVDPNPVRGWSPRAQMSGRPFTCVPNCQHITEAYHCVVRWLVAAPAQRCRIAPASASMSHSCLKLRTRTYQTAYPAAVVRVGGACLVDQCGERPGLVVSGHGGFNRLHGTGARLRCCRFLSLNSLYRWLVESSIR